MDDRHRAYQAYLEARHARFGVPEALVGQMVRAATGKPLISSERMVKGADNEVYVVTTAERQAVVVRIRRAGDSGMRDEAWALAAAREVGVPVPEVLLVDRLHDGDEVLEYMVQTRMEGRSLDDLGRQLTPGERDHALRDMGAMLARLHTVHTAGFYKRGDDGTWDFPTWPALMACMVDARRGERPWLLSAGVSDAEFAFAIRSIERYGREFDCETPVLCHGDFTPEHVFVDERGRVCGVIDFGMYEGNHPIHDLAMIRMWTDAPTAEAIRRGYANDRALGEPFELRLSLHVLMQQVGYLAHHMQIPGHPDVPLYLEGLRASIRRVQEHG
jgi:aminoglycoside phosphotransferase (APT) family kinase protein